MQMKTKLLLLKLVILEISLHVNSQNLNYNLAKKLILKKTDYSINLPQGFKIEFTNSTDFLGYHIVSKNKENNLQIWLYLGLS